MNETTGIEVGTVDVLQIMQMIPHRYPMLMVDRVVELVADQSAVGIKNVSINEPHFVGHFPTRPIMPGVMIVEAMAQTAAVLVAYSDRELAGSNRLVYFLSIENARFRKPVVPGDTMRIHVTKTHRRGNVWKFDGKSTVDGKVVAEANFSAMLVDG
ncbi:MAG: 3-hydroxyacyl-ACP dehydratase FabZ [Alphaproteobacteria bacterium]|nr:3-hydroxyacyl-ACP dehydratase FabZ [Alphaproteobacteria bacterium]